MSTVGVSKSSAESIMVHIGNLLCVVNCEGTCYLILESTWPRLIKDVSDKARYSLKCLIKVKLRKMPV